jgi:glycosyltransferase involved in cell wall biosynthesis
MRVLLNVTTAVKGGALHLATSLIREALASGDRIDWHIAISRLAKQELDRLSLSLPACVTVLEKSPSRSRRSRRALAKLELQIRPDCVFTPYGPAYVRFRTPHLVGVAEPYVLHPSRLAYRTLPFPHGWIKVFVSAKYRGHWFRKADAWWVETERAKRGLVERLALPPDRIHVVPNTCSAQYRDQQTRRDFPESSRELRLLYFTAPYWHKYLDMVPRVAKALVDRRHDLEFRMVTTLPEDHAIYRQMMNTAQSLGVSRWIVNLGPIPVADGPELYRSCDICFMPTVLEVFSATYPEAMAMGLPIVTSDLEFAREICQNAALYFPASDPSGAAECILRLVADRQLWVSLQEEATRVLSQLPTPREKYNRYVELLRQLADEGRARAERD